MTTVDFLPFANDASAANVVTQASYLAAASGSGYVQNGFPSGRADSNKANKALRQSSVMAAAIAQFIAAETGQNVLDSGGASSVTALTSQLLQALQLACLPNNSHLIWDTTYQRLSVSGTNYPQILALNPSDWAGVALRGNSNQSLIMHYGSLGDATNELRFGRWSQDMGTWQANPVKFDMDALDSSLVVGSDSIAHVRVGVGFPDGRTQTESAQFPSGTAMLFAQSAAPTGWTKSTAHNDKMLRIVSGTAGSGGSAGVSTAWSAVALSGSVLGHTLTVTELPPHTHSGTTGGQSADHHHSIPVTTSSFVCNGSGANFAIVGGTVTGGTSNDHNHSITTDNGTGGGSYHTHGLTVNSFTVTPLYVDAIICVKN